MDLNGRSTGRSLFDEAVYGGGRALGQVSAGLAENAPADIVSLKAGHVAIEGRTGDLILDGWIFTAREPAVDSVWVDGRKVVAGGTHIRRDEIRSRFDRTMKRLLA
jgi:cytosine/adenosine deaminase-related metal-dependent hydrolase